MKLPAAVGNNSLFDFHVVSADSYRKPISDHSLIERVGNTEDGSLLEAHFAIVGTFVFEMSSDVERVSRAVLQSLLICCEQFNMNLLECHLVDDKHGNYERINQAHISH